MKLITGLGNPEKEYQNTRHNAGFLFLDALRERFLYQKDLTVTEWEKEDMFLSDISILKKGSHILAVLQKPRTYMNRSGEAVAKIVKKLEIQNLDENFILVHDDLDLGLGKFKIQQGKSPIGHNGVKDVETRLGSSDFKRVRIGIENRLEKNIPGEKYVLMKFSEEERIILDEIVQESINGILAEIMF